MSLSARLAELGIELPDVPAPLASYVPAVRYGGLVQTSGQLPLVDGKLPATGLVGESAAEGQVDAQTATDLARRCALNALAAAAQAAGGLDNLERVIKVTGFVASAPGFRAQPAVLNGASDVLGEIFGDAGRHARSAVGVAELPNAAPVEVEVLFSVRD